MNPLSSIPPTPPQGDPASSLKETVLSPQDSVNDASVSPSSPPMDVVSLSTSPQEVSNYLKQMSHIPDVREARIAHIQSAIDSNSYNISPEKLADTLLQELSSQPKDTLTSTDS